MFVLTANQNSFNKLVQKSQDKKWYKFVSSLSDVYGLSNQTLLVLRDAVSRREYTSIVSYCQWAGWDIKYK